MTTEATPGALGSNDQLGPGSEAREMAAFVAWAVKKYGQHAYRHTSATSGEWAAWQAARAHSEGRIYTQADLLEAVRTERHACSICVWMVLQDALEPGADDKGLEGWMREAEQRVKNRLAHHGAEAPPPQQAPAECFCWLVEEFSPDGNSTGRYMLDQGALTTTTDVHSAKRLRRWRSAGLRALDMKAQHKGDWRAVEHGFGA